MAAFSAEQLAGMRSTVEDGLVDSCVISEKPSETFDPNTGAYTTTPGAQVYSGACRFGSVDSQDRVVEVGGNAVSLRTYKLHLPWDATGIEVSQVVVGTSGDPHLDGSEFRVVDVKGTSDVVGRSVMIEEFLG